MKISRFLQEWGVLVAFALLLIGAIVTNGAYFGKPEVLLNLLSQNVEVGIIATGMTLVIIAGGIDLSVGSMMALCSCVGLAALVKAGQAGQPGAMTLGIIFVAGLVLGAINGLTVTWGRVVPFVATLVGLLVFRSLSQVIADNGTITPGATVASIDFLTTKGLQLPFSNAVGKPLLLNFAVIVMVLVALLAGLVLTVTPFGRHVIAVGSNDRAAHYSAIPVNRVRFFTYVILGACVGIAAGINASRMGSVASATTGGFYELDAIAAVVIGGTSLLGGKGRVWGTFVGVLLLGLISTMLVAAHVSDAWRGVVKGCIILVAVFIQRGRSAT